MAYTQNQCQSVTFSSSDTRKQCNPILIAFNDTVTNYIRVYFPSAGSAAFKFAAVVFSGSIVVRGWITNSTSGFNTNNGYPTSSVIASDYNTVGTAQTTVVNNITIPSAGYYYFYFRTDASSTSVTPIITFQASSSPMWTDDGYIDLGTISSTYSHTISSVSAYKIYCFKIQVGYGTLIYKHQYDGENVQINISGSYSSSQYNSATGYLGSGSVTGMTPDISYSTGSSGATLYLWIRHSDGTDTSNLTFTIIPPGANWQVNWWESNTVTEVTKMTGHRWPSSGTYSSGEIQAKHIYYIPLTFSPSGSYNFKYTGSDQVNGYITTSTSINPETGVPLSSLASDSSSSSGFDITTNLSSGPTYYLMFRCRGTNANSSSFRINIAWSDTNPTPTWSYSTSSSSSSVTVTVNNASDYWLSYYLKDVDNNTIIFDGQTDGRTKENPKTFSGLSIDTNYNLAVTIYTDQYWSDGEEDLYSTDGNLVESFIITQQWSYNSQSIITVSSTPISSQYYGLTKKTGRMFTFNFGQSGTLTISSSSPGSGLISYFGLSNTGYNSSTGQPYSIYDSDTGTFSYTYVGNQNQYCYLWVTTSNQTSGFTLDINFVVTPTYPTYTYTISGNSITFNVSNRGSYYLSYIVRLTSDSEDRTYTLYYTTNTSPTASGLLWNTSYTINVGYSDTEYGTINWIGSNTITTGSSPTPSGDGKIHIYTGSGSGQGWKLAKPYIFTGSSWQPVSAYIFNGSVWKKTKG